MNSVSATRKAGWPKGKQGKRLSLADRFWPKVQRGGIEDCWLWTGGLRRGRGIIGAGGADGKPLYAHRVVFEIMGYGKIPDGLEIDHACRNPRCVNPHHLRAVTPRVNSIQNNHSPFALNRAKTHCKYGHEFTDENTALKPPRDRHNKDGTLVPSSRPTRVCLTCRPSEWRNAIVPRKPPPGARLKAHERQQQSSEGKENG